MKTLSQNRKQQGHYRMLVDAAYMAEAQRLQGEIPRKDEWRRKINLDTTGYYSTKEMNQTTDFDKVMLELAIMAGDDYWMNRLITSAERRLRHVIRWFIYDLEYLKKEQVKWSYIKAICKQAGYSDNLLDCPAEHLANVMQMVDSYVRKLAKEQKIARADLPSGYMRKGYSDAEAIAAFRHDHHHHIKHGEAA